MKKKTCSYTSNSIHSRMFVIDFDKSYPNGFNFKQKMTVILTKSII